jgi:hypothetical protein
MIGLAFSRRGRILALVATLALIVVGLVAFGLMTSASQKPPFFGVAVPAGDLRRAAAFTERMDCQPSVLSIFVKLDSPSFTVEALQQISAAGAVPFLTLEPWSYRSPRGVPDQPEYTLASIVAGAHDDALRGLARVLADYGKPVYLRFAHEMNASWYPWGTGNGNTPAQYVAAWRHVRGILSRSTGVHAWWVWSPEAVSSANAAVPLSAFYPGDDAVDFVGLTGYRTANSRQSDAWQTYHTTLTALAAVTSKPVILAEIGAAGARKAEWLASLGAFLRAERRVVGLVYFNTTPATTGASGEYALQSKLDFSSLRQSLVDAGSCPQFPAG